MTNAAGGSGYGRIAAELFADAPWPARLRQRIRPAICPFEWIVDRVPARARVLDVGCGDGLLLGLLAWNGKVSVGTGLDSSAAAIRAARAVARRVSASGAELEFRVQDALTYETTSSHDVVCMVDVLHHVPRPLQAAVLARACAAVRPGGLLIYKDIACRPSWRAAPSQLHDLLISREWVHFIEIDVVEQWAAENAMSVQAKDAARRLWYEHELRIFRRTAPDSLDNDGHRPTTRP